MIELSLLLSGIKSCSYVNKHHENNNHHHKHKQYEKIDEKELLNEIGSKMKFSKPDEVSLKKLSLNNLSSEVLQIIKEPFETNNTSIRFMMIIVVSLIIIFFVYLVMKQESSKK